MKNILVFAGSNSPKSINQKLAVYAAGFLEKCSTRIIQLKDYQAPLFNIEIEKNEGIPETIVELSNLLKSHDGFIISLPEYNSSITPVFKNTVDWISRYEQPVFKNKPVLLMSTSPGKGGGQTNLQHVMTLMPHWGATVVSTFCLPNFNDYMDAGTISLKNVEKENLLIAVKQLEDKLK